MRVFGIKILSIVVVGALVFGEVIFACMAAPPQTPQWVKVKGADYQYALDVQNKKVIIADATDKTKVRWTAQLSHYSYGSFSVKVVDAGKRVVSIRYNRGVRKVTDIVVESAAQDGTTVAYPASDFIAALQPFKPRTIKGKDGSIQVMRMSMDPTLVWSKKIELIDAKGITVTNALGVKTVKSWQDAKEVAKK